MEINAEILDTITTGLKLIGITSFSGFIALQVAWVSFPPELAIEGTIDKSKRLNSESRLKLKNLGKIPAANVRTKLTNLNLALNGIKMRNAKINSSPKPISRLASGESTEISVTPGVFVNDGGSFSEFEYNIEISYEARILLIKKRFYKKWHVALKNTGEEFSWIVSIE
jgi:hypothetical protein